MTGPPSGTHDEARSSGPRRPDRAREERPERFVRLAERLTSEDNRITERTMVGLPAVAVDRRVFAATSFGDLLVKLGEPRVDALVRENVGEHFGTFEHRSWREWLLVLDPDADWHALASEARDLVARQAQHPPEGAQ